MPGSEIVELREAFRNPKEVRGDAEAATTQDVELFTSGLTRITPASADIEGIVPFQSLAITPEATGKE